MDAAVGPAAMAENYNALDALLAGEEPADPREELLEALACHPSLKAGDTFTNEDATRLVRRLWACEQPFACLHGRPTVLGIDEATFTSLRPAEHAIRLNGVLSFCDAHSNRLCGMHRE